MGSLSGWRLLVLSLALVGLLARHTAGQAVVMTDPNSTCSEVCGSEGCPCPDLESAFAQASEAAVNGTIVTIELAPGVYLPSSTLAFTSACFQLMYVAAIFPPHRQPSKLPLFGGLILPFPCSRSRLLLGRTPPPMSIVPSPA